MICKCHICERYRGITGWIIPLPLPTRTHAEKLLSDLINTEEDRDYYRCLVDGSWPKADEIIQRIREKKPPKVVDATPSTG